MDMIKAIQNRISRRSYLGTPLAENHLETLFQAMEQANSESGLTITFLADGGEAFEGTKSYGMFSGVKSMLLLKGPSDLPHLKEKVGYYGEELILLATSLGLGTCWVGGTFDKSSASFGIGPEETLVCVVPVGNVAEKETMKEKMIRGTVRHKVKEIEQMVEADRPLTEEENAAMALVQIAPTARNTQKVLFHFNGDTITATVPDDYPFDLVDLGICKYHFEQGMKGKFQWGNGSPFCQE